MAINALLGSSRAYDSVPSMPIGEEDRNIFSCPVCSRPLATGVRRCPGCRTRLMLGVPMARASVFASVGLVVGLGVGSVIGATALAGGANRGGPGPSAPAVVVVPSSSAPAPSVTPAPTARPSIPAVPATAKAAMGQVGTLAAKLADAREDLQFALDQEDLDGVEVAETLRTMNSTAAFGVDVAHRLGTWDRAGRLAEDLEALYEEIRRTARTGLTASVRNDAAYRTAAQDMLVVLGKMGPLLDEARSLALTIDVDLPRVDAGDEVTTPS
jgi:hypothetical protein